MIRFVDLGTQISATPEFAWYNTVSDKFLVYCGTSTWATWEDFKEDYYFEPGYPLDRFEILCPQKWKET